MGFPVIGVECYWIFIWPDVSTVDKDFHLIFVSFLFALFLFCFARCVDDDDQNDWVHKEITTALNSGCNIIPITNDFEWPQVSHSLNVFITCFIFG